MEEQVPPSQPPVNPQITPEQLQQMKARARDLAIQQTLAQNAPVSPPQPQVIYVRRNLTLAEIVIILLLSCGLVTGVQFTWNVVNDFLPRLEINIK
jgi:hypothetical protein|tara:strand:- start:390 stop:677 length:288 start_codon:yes stop_codon:yes gene_type:complete